MSIHPRGKKGILHGRFWVGGKEVWRSLGITGSKKSQPAKREYARRLLELTAKARGAVVGLSWDDFVERYKKEYGRVEKRASTNLGDGYIFQLFERTMNPMASTDLTPAFLREFTGKRSGHVTNRTINRQMGLLKNLAWWGQREGYVDRDFDFKGVTKLEEVKKRRVFYHENEVAAMKKLLPAQPLKVRLLVSAGLWSGLRSGELRWLKVSYFDFSNSIINVTSLPGWAPKDGEERVVPFYKPFKLVVREWIKQQKLGPDAFVFAHHDKPPRGRPWRGRQMHTSYFNTVFKEFLVDKVKLKKGSYYSGRHTYATFFPGDVAVLQQVLGHSNLETTMIYKHNRREAVQRAAKDSPY